MKRLNFFSYLVFVIILVVNLVYYNNLYQKQISYEIKLLSQQVQLIGSDVGESNIYFESDINKIFFGERMEDFFSDEEVKDRVTEKLKFFYSKYDDFVVNVMISNISSEVFTLYKDIESDEAWIVNSFLAQRQKEIFNSEMLIENRDRYDFYLPYIDNQGRVVGNLTVTVDYLKYFNSQFNKYKLEDYQWQWLIDEEGRLIFTNYFSGDATNPKNIQGISIKNIDQIYQELLDGISGHRIHSIDADGESMYVISSYYPATLLKKDFGIVFSAPTDFYQKYIIRNSIAIVSITLFLVLIIILLFRRYIKRQSYSANLIRESEQTLISLIDLMPVGVIITDINREVIKSNSAAATMFSYQDRHIMEGKIMPENMNSGEGLYFAENLGSGYEANQFMVVKKEGADTILYRKEIPVKFRNSEASMIVLIDVTLLEAARKQEVRANEAKSEFLAKISHEIRTPLNGIIGMAGILSQMKSNPEVTKIVSLIKNSSDLLLGIINDLLDFSRIESGKLLLDEIPFDIRKEIEYCFNVVIGLANKNVKLKWEVDEGVSESLIGDPFRLRQALTNLLITSIEHTDTGLVELKCSSEEESRGIIQLNFELRDTGRGYDRTAFKRIFGEYIEAERKSIDENEGKGLGGLIARQLIEMMGGELKPSTPSGLSDDPETPGARFRFSIKVYSNNPAEKDYRADKVLRYSDIRTLVIGGGRQRDEELLNALHKFGLSTYVTSWQNQTLSMIKSNLLHPGDKYNMIIILDTPDFDGFDVGREIYEAGLYTQFMMLMVSSNDKVGNYSQCILNGIDDYLVKPFHLSELFNIIQNRFPNIEVELSEELSQELKKDIRILVAEDNIINQKVATTILKSLGCEADIAKNGKEAVDMAGDNTYDIIFMDLIMPVMDGFEASTKILAGDKKVKIVALTADSASETVKKVELCGIHHFIAKPVRQEEIRNILFKYFSETIG